MTIRAAGNDEDSRSKIPNVLANSTDMFGAEIGQCPVSTDEIKGAICDNSE